MPNRLVTRVPFITILCLLIVSWPTSLATADSLPRTVQAPTNGLQVREVLRIGQGRIFALAPQPGGKLVAVASAIGLWIYRLDTWVFVKELLPNHAVVDVSWSVNGKLLATISDAGSIDVWDAATLTKKTSFQLELPLTASSIVWASDSTRFAVLYVKNEQLSDTNRKVQSLIVIWNSQTQREVIRTDFLDTYLTRIAWSPDGSSIAAGVVSLDLVQTVDIPVFSSRTAKEQLHFAVQASLVSGVAWSPDGTRLSAITDHGTVEIHNTRTGKLIKNLAASPPGAIITDTVWSPNGALLATGDYQGHIATWQTSNWSLKTALDGHTRAIDQLSWLADNRTLISVGQDSAVRVWDVIRKKSVAVLVLQPELPKKYKPV